MLLQLQDMPTCMLSSPGKVCTADTKSWSDLILRAERSAEGSQENGGRSSVPRERVSPTAGSRTQYDSNVFNVILNEIPPRPLTGAERQDNSASDGSGDNQSIQTNVIPNGSQNDQSSTNRVGTVIPPSTTRNPLSPRNSPPASSRPSRARVDGVLVRNIILQAITNVQTEEQTLEQRLRLGIDKSITQFETPEPSIFSESPLNVSPLSRTCRVINWIGTMLNDFKVPLTIPQVLTHPEAVLRRIFCPFRNPVCNSDEKYRTIDGSCNNIRRPLIGAAFTPMARELAPVYENDRRGKIDLPRTNGRFGPLPSAREVSSVVHSDRGSQERATRWSMQLTLWGQMIAHDLTDRAPGKGFAESVMSCCNQRIPTPACFGIPLPQGDKLRDSGRSCLDFARSVEVTDLDCKLGRREQLNQASSFIDAGFIYGVTRSKIRRLRTRQGGLLATSLNDHLPIVPHPNRQASFQGYSFFAAGDDRVNEHTGLMGVETVWVREHNRIAKTLGAINPGWDDETLFQETRRIVSAMVQHITYNEYLPQVIGTASMTHYGLWPLTEGYFKGYDSSVNPSASNVFTTAAARFGHSMIRSTFSLMDMSFNSTDEPILPLKDTFFTSITFLETEHAMMRGTMMDQSEPCDRMISGDLLNKLHQTREGNGGDLAAFNIQRGRDHALASYTAWRKFYGFPEIRNFTNTTGGFEDHPMETVELLERVYISPDDVDVWTGGISEVPVEDAAVGPLFANIIGNQFKRLKYGDRYFYESDSQPVPFTPEQLREIRKVTYASVLCNNQPFRTIQPEAFLLTTQTSNAKIPCSNIQGIDLLKWQEL
ncbi:chorion peroxidase-like [Liolophura sinensis]|uniref:chorion peroxidase-like n=1 Tax=Liolophura sinensis TaxID=3198878 RepID=UPI003158AB4B